MVYSFPNKQIEQKFDHAIEVRAPSGEAVDSAVGQKAIRSSAIKFTGSPFSLHSGGALHGYEYITHVCDIVHRSCL